MAQTVAQTVRGKCLQMRILAPLMNAGLPEFGEAKIVFDIFYGAGSPASYPHNSAANSALRAALKRLQK